jgi:hypothetical protein
VNQLAAAAGENRRAVNKARPLLLAAPGGESSDAAAVWRHAAEDCHAAGASRTGYPQSAADFDDDMGEGEVSKIRPEKRRFHMFYANARQKRPLPRPGKHRGPKLGQKP